MKQPIPEDWNETDWCCFSVDWPDSVLWRGILMGLLSSPAQGRFWDEKTGTITDIQQVGDEISIRNLPLREELMGCQGATELANAITALIGRITTTGGCCGAPGTFGGNGTGGSGPAGELPEAPYDPEGDPPAGYDTWEDYFADVCAKATWLVNLVNDDLTRMGTIQLAIATVAALAPILATLLLDPIPGDELFALAALLIAMAAYGAGTLAQVKESFSDAVNDIICDLYTAAGPEDGKTAALATFRSRIEGDTTDPVVVEYGVQLVGVMLSWDGLNKVYTLQEGVSYPAGDCASCEPVDCGDFITKASGTEMTVTTLENGDYQVDISSELITGTYYAGWGLSEPYDDECSCAQIMDVDVVSGSIDSPSVGHDTYSCGSHTYQGIQDPLANVINSQYNLHQVASITGPFTIRWVLRIPTS